MHNIYERNDIMDENAELLEYIYKNSEMGIFTITELLKNLNNKENKIKNVAEKQLKEFEQFYKDCKKILEKNNVTLKKNSSLSKIGTSMGIKMETMKDNSDASIAHMLIQGITMGTVEISSKIDNYKNVVDKKNIDLAKKYLITLENQIEELKKYL